MNTYLSVWVLKRGYAQFRYVLKLSLGLQIDDDYVRNTSYIKMKIFEYFLYFYSVLYKTFVLFCIVI